MSLHTFKWIFLYHLLVNSLLEISLNDLELVCLHTGIDIVFTQLNGKGMYWIKPWTAEP